MYLGRQRAEWERHAQMMALHINMNRARGKQPISPEKLNPYAFVRRRAPAKKLAGKRMLAALRMLCPNAEENRKD